MQSHRHPELDASAAQNTSILMQFADKIDLVMTLADVRSQMQAYSSLSSLSMINREYHAMLGPYLKKTEAKIVVDMSKLDALPTQRYKDIEIIECSPGSRVPAESNDIDQARGLSRKAMGFAPWLLTFRGEPKKYVFAVQERYFPGVKVVRLVNNEKYMTLEQADGCGHCPWIGCDCAFTQKAFDQYCNAFFESPREDSRRASVFRYQVTDVSPPSGSRNDRIFYTMDMESKFRKAWEYRREKNIDVAGIHDLLHEQFPYNEWGSHGFDDLRMESLSGIVKHITIKTYIYVRPGACIHPSFSWEGLWEFESELREMADDCLDLGRMSADFSFELFMHHGDEPNKAREDMKPVFSVSYSPTENGNRVTIDDKQIDQDFLTCAKNKGCKRCKVAKKK